MAEDQYLVVPAGAPLPASVPVTEAEMIALMHATEVGDRYLRTAFGRLIVYVDLPDDQWVMDVLTEMRS